LFGGVAALKPGYGRFPSDRSVGPRDATLASQLVPVDGVLARSVADLHLAFQVLAGPDPRDPRVAPAPLWGPPPARPVRVAVITSPGGQAVHPQVAEALAAAAEALRAGGYRTETADLPALAEAVEAYGHMVMTEFHQSRPLLERLLGEEGRRYVELAVALREPVDLAAYLALTARRQGLQRQWSAFFAEYPVALAPVFTEPVVPAGYDIRGPQEHRQVTEAMRVCTATSFIGVPAVAVPTGIVGGQPQGVQLIAGFFREDLCLEAAAAVESRLRRFTPIDPQW
jgi:amidase